MQIQNSAFEDSLSELKSGYESMLSELAQEVEERQRAREQAEQELADLTQRYSALENCLREKETVDCQQLVLRLTSYIALLHSKIA